MSGHRRFSHEKRSSGQGSGYTMRTETEIHPPDSYHKEIQAEASKHRKRGLAQRLKHGTAQALGIAKDTNFDKLQTVNKHIADNLAGHSEETVRIDEMVDMMHHVADEDEEDDFLNVSRFRLDKHQVKDLNKAFLEDMKTFNPGQNDNISIHSDAFNDLDDRIQRTVDKQSRGSIFGSSHRQKSKADSTHHSPHMSTKSLKTSQHQAPGSGRELEAIHDEEDFEIQIGSDPAAASESHESIGFTTKHRVGSRETSLIDSSTKYKASQGGRTTPPTTSKVRFVREATEPSPLPVYGGTSGHIRRGTVYHNHYSSDIVSPAKLNIHRFQSKQQMRTTHVTDNGEVETTQWDAPPIITEERCQFKITNDMNRALTHNHLPHDDEITKEEVQQHAAVNDCFINIPSDVKAMRALDFEMSLHGKTARRPIPQGQTMENFLYGREALDHFNRYKRVERSIYKEKFDEEKFFWRMELQDKKTKIEASLEIAKEHYCSNHGFGHSLKQRLGLISEKPKEKLSKMTHATAASLDDGSGLQLNTGLRLQLESLKTYTPWFLIVMTLLQAIGTIVQLGLAGIAPVSFSKTYSVKEYETWGGMMEVSFENPTNVWIGPTSAMLVQLGAVFPPCLRKDVLITLRFAKYYGHEAAGLGCCEIAGSGAGTATAEECEKIAVDFKVPAHTWRNVTCNKRDLRLIGSRIEPHKFKPCCYGRIGQCMLTSYDHCEHIDGIWHSDAREHCSHTHCGEEVCNTWNIHSAGGDDHKDETHLAPYSNTTAELMPNGYHQFWRVLVSLFFHHGILHLAFVAIVQLVMGLAVERVAGWGRIGAIYALSGFGGLLFGSMLKPYEPNVGAHGAAFGLLGMNFVELLQAWKLVEHPERPLIKLIVYTVIGLAIGFMPEMNLLTQVGGFVFGVMSSIIFLPFVTFNHWHKQARLILIILFTLLVGILYSIIIFLFHMYQPIGLGQANSPDCIVDNHCEMKSRLVDLV